MCVYDWKHSVGQNSPEIVGLQVSHFCCSMEKIFFRRVHLSLYSWKYYHCANHVYPIPSRKKRRRIERKKVFHPFTYIFHSHSYCSHFICLSFSELGAVGLKPDELPNVYSSVHKAYPYCSTFIFRISGMTLEGWGGGGEKSDDPGLLRVNSDQTTM